MSNSLSCEKNPTLLDKEAVSTLLDNVPDWALSQDNKSISRCFHFKNYYQTISFVNATAWVSHQQDHHPDLEVGYNRCNVTFSTHSIGGISHNDFICAVQFDTLISPDN